VALLVQDHFVPVRFSMLLDGPGADEAGRDWVSAHIPAGQLAISPPGVFVTDASRDCRLHLNYRAPADQWRAALAGVVGVSVPDWATGPRAQLAQIEGALRDGRRAGAAATLHRWVGVHGASDPDGAAWATLLLGAAAYRAGDVGGAHAHWRSLIERHPNHPLTHRARYHLLDQETWPTRPHADLLGAPLLPSPTPSRSSAGLRGAPYRHNRLGMAFAPIPAGRFTMGGSPALLPREEPAHPVELTRDYWLSATTVTRAQWAEFRPPAAVRSGVAARPTPMTGASFADAEAFCAWLSEREGRVYRLPTEAEWERAARGGLEAQAYPWGAEPISPERCNYLGPRPVAVASYAPNAYGLHDMVGNLQEWTSDRFREAAYAERVQRAAAGDRGALTDPTGRAVADEGLPLRVVRGGQCGSSVIQLFCRNSFRLGLFEEYDGGSIGVRVLLEAF